ncbi:hypothetical protein DFH28DRAFT_1130546 [Melampsora americana]|nr:hypothetical protein DFH28DRAFT_1130546 [Melampsora americana]
MESNTPLSNQQDIDITPQTTPSLTPTNVVQNPPIAVGANTPGTHSPLSSTSFPPLSTADWVRLAQINPVTSGLIPHATYQEPLMAPPDPPKKTRGRPKKQPAPPRSNSVRLSKPLPDHQASNKKTIEITNESQNEIGKDENEEKDITSSKKCWYTPQSEDGKSDMDVVAEWCSIHENFDSWRTQRQVVVRERVAAFLASRNHPNRSGRECEKKVKLLDKWFRWADELKTATGEGNQGRDPSEAIEFDVPSNDIEAFKMAKRRGGGKKEEDAGSLQVRMLRRCPWYEELEPVMGDRPSARPLALRDSLGDQDQNASTSTNVDEVEASPAASDSTLPYEQWEETPPREVRRRISMDLEVADDGSPSLDPKFNLPKTQETSNRKRPSLSGPDKPAIKRGRLNGVETPLTLHDSPKDPLGLGSLVDRIPTKEDRDERERLAAQTQEHMATNITSAISKILTTNRTNELATKEKIARNDLHLKIEEMNLKNRLARSQMVMELIRGNMAPSEAEAMALRQLPDIKMPEQSPLSPQPSSFSSIHDSISI